VQTSCRGILRHWTITRLVMLIVLCACSLNAWAESRVLIVLSSNSAQYQECAVNAKKTISKIKGVTIVTKALSEIVQSDLDALAPSDVCLAIGAKASVGIGRKLNPSVPMVYAMVSNPRSLGLESRPNTAGISADVSPADQFDLMKRVMGNVKTIGVLYRSSSQRSNELLSNARSQLPAGWVLKEFDMDTFGTDAKAVNALVGQRVDFAWMISDPKVYSPGTVKALLIASLKHKLRVFAFSSQVVKAGALIGVGIDPSEQGVSAGQIVSESLLNGISAADLLSGPAFPHITLNQVVAKRIGITFPNDLIREADDLYD